MNIKAPPHVLRIDGPGYLGFFDPSARGVTATGQADGSIRWSIPSGWTDNNPGGGAFCVWEILDAHHGVRINNTQIAGMPEVRIWEANGLPTPGGKNAAIVAWAGIFMEDSTLAPTDLVNARRRIATAGLKYDAGLRVVRALWVSGGAVGLTGDDATEQGNESAAALAGNIGGLGYGSTFQLARQIEVQGLNASTGSAQSGALATVAPGAGFCPSGGAGTFRMYVATGITRVGAGAAAETYDSFLTCHALRVLDAVP